MMFIALSLAYIAQVALAFPSTLDARDVAAEEVGFISVSVATVWTDSSKPRPVDAPALTNPANIEEWLGSMTLDQYLDLTDSDRTQTQALYGTRVNILSQQDGWYEVAVNGQPTPKNSLGYPGWVPAAQVSLDSTYGELLQNKPFAAVDKVANSSLYRDALMTQAYLDISYDTRLPVINQLVDTIQVAVPGGGSAFVPSQHATIYNSVSSIPYPTGKDLVNAGKLFLDRPYLWGGASGFAFDCSGFTHTLYDARGITIARDSDAQADFTGHGTNVSRSDLEAGDLIFYASNLTDPSSIYHVAMYAGNGKMLEAYGAGIPVRLTDVRFNDDYWGAERFLTH